jgi:glycerate kinase
MKVLISPDKFKGSLTAREACEAINAGIRDQFPDIQTIELPLADGGNGTAEILADSSKGRMISCRVHDPLLRMINSSFGISGDGKTAFVEMAAASGLELLKNEERNCYYTSSFGTGELILAACRENVNKIILCIGGSATNDGGIGMAAALGYRFLDINNNLLETIGMNLEFIQNIDDSGIDPIIKNIEIEVACDVDNPLTGPLGAAWIYGPQKGASKEELQRLDFGLENFARAVHVKYGYSIREIPGSGAAGGLGGGAIIFLHAKLKRGIEIVLDYLRFDEHLKSSQLVITGEGKLDKQSLSGKVIQGVIKAASKYKVPVIALAGKIEISETEIKNCGLQKAYCINARGVSIEEALKNASANLRSAAGKMALETLKN